MKFNFNINRIRFGVGGGQRSPSPMDVICITRGNGALNGERSSQLSALSSREETLIPSRTLFSKAIQDSSQLFRSVFHLAGWERFEIAQFLCYEQLGFEFEQGTPSTIQELSKFLAGVASFAFGDVAGNRYGCSPHLGGQAIKLVFRKLLGGSINLQCQIRRFTPRDQVSVSICHVIAPNPLWDMRVVSAVTLVTQSSVGFPLLRAES
jgi:hypothetical protein